MTIFIRSSRDP